MHWQAGQPGAGSAETDSRWMVFLSLRYSVRSLRFLASASCRACVPCCELPPGVTMVGNPWRALLAAASLCADGLLSPAVNRVFQQGNYNEGRTSACSGSIDTSRNNNTRSRFKVQKCLKRYPLNLALGPSFGQCKMGAWHGQCMPSPAVHLRYHCALITSRACQESACSAAAGGAAVQRLSPLRQL